MLVKVLGDEKPDHLAVAFDAPAKTFRKEMDATYKAGRKETPDLFRSQLPLIRQVLEALAVPMLEVAGVEADDVIGTLAVRAAAQGMDTIVVTGDRDSYQLVRDPHLKVLYNKRGVSDYALYDEAGILERTGVTPAAVRRLRRAPRRQERQPPGRSRHRREDRGEARQHLRRRSKGSSSTSTTCRRSRRRTSASSGSRSSTTARCRCCGPTWTSSSTRTTCAWAAGTARRCSCSSSSSSSACSIRACSKRSATRPRRRADRCRARRDGPAAACGRTTIVEALAGIWRRRGERYAIEAALGPRRPSRPRLDGLAFTGVDRRRGLRARRRPARCEPSPRSSRRLVALGGPPLVAHRAKELMHGARRRRSTSTCRRSSSTPRSWRTCWIRGSGSTTSSSSRSGSSSSSSRHRIARRERSTSTSTATSRPTTTGRRAVAVLRLGDRTRRRASKRASSPISTRRSSGRSCGCSPRWRSAGIKIDREFLEELRSELQEPVRRPRAQDPRARRRAVRRQLGAAAPAHPVREARAHAGEADEDRAVHRRRLAREDGGGERAPDPRRPHEVPRGREAPQHLRRRAAAADRADGRIHATFNQIATTTGRISSENPNLQNIPVRSEGGREMRRAFVADEGSGLLAADYSQIELRVLAHLAEDPGLIDAFARGADVHTITAAKVFDVDETKVDAFQRRFAKVVNYGLAFGMEAYGLGQRLNIPTDQAKRDPRQLLRVVPERARVHGAHRRRGEAAGLHDDDPRSAPPDLGALVGQLPHQADGGADGAERAGAGICGRHLQARDGRRRPRARRARAPRPG